MFLSWILGPVYFFYMKNITKSKTVLEPVGDQ